MKYWGDKLLVTLYFITFVANFSIYSPNYQINV